MQPLDGVFVLDFTTLLPGPMATLLLAEAGAEVVKVERPDRGDEMRGYEPKWGGNSINFAMLNRGKKSISLDLKKSEDRAKLQPLVERADVIVEQFRPGTMARLGLDYESVTRVNPRVVYCAITGYGQTGPKRNAAGHDLNYIGDAGLLSLSMGSAAHPVLPPALIADIAGGAYPAVMNILFALMNRRNSGAGCYLDISMTDNLFPFMYWAVGNVKALGMPPGNGSDLVTGGSPRYHLYATKDNKIVAAAPLEQKFWEAFCEIILLEPQFRDDAQDATMTMRRVAEIISADTAEVWRRRFSDRDCCCSIVASVQEALDDPQFKARKLFDWEVANENGQRMSALPVPVMPPFRMPAGSAVSPQLGEQNGKYLL